MQFSSNMKLICIFNQICKKNLIWPDLKNDYTNYVITYNRAEAKNLFKLL